jgi:hypothetical protein
MPLRLTLELIPYGDESKKSVMGVLDIENRGDNPNHPQKGNYRFHLTGPIHGGGVDFWHAGYMEDFERSRGYWATVKEILNTIDVNAQPETE